MYKYPHMLHEFPCPVLDNNAADPFESKKSCAQLWLARFFLDRSEHLGQFRRNCFSNSLNLSLRCYDAAGEKLNDFSSQISSFGHRAFAQFIAFLFREGKPSNSLAHDL
jgi:hypothetical protein